MIHIFDKFDDNHLTGCNANISSSTVLDLYQCHHLCHHCHHLCHHCHHCCHWHYHHHCFIIVVMRTFPACPLSVSPAQGSTSMKGFLRPAERPGTKNDDCEDSFTRQGKEHMRPCYHHYHLTDSDLILKLLQLSVSMPGLLSKPLELPGQPRHLLLCQMLRRIGGILKNFVSQIFSSFS